MQTATALVTDTNIEKYINGIRKKIKIDWTDMRNNYDTLAEKGKLM